MGLDFPEAVNVVRVQTALEMFEAATDLWPSMDIGCATAAVADFRPMPFGEGKFKKGDLAGDNLMVEFEPPITLTSSRRSASTKQKGSSSSALRPRTGDLQGEAERKLKSKRLDLLAANDVSEQGSGFGTATNRMFVLDAAGRKESWPQLPKTEVAWRLWDHLLLG